MTFPDSVGRRRTGRRFGNPSKDNAINTKALKIFGLHSTWLFDNYNKCDTNDRGPIFARENVHALGPLEDEYARHEEMANEIIVRLPPGYRDFLGAMAKYHPQDQPREERVTEQSLVPEKTPNIAKHYYATPNR